MEHKYRLHMWSCVPNPFGPVSKTIMAIHEASGRLTSLKLNSKLFRLGQRLWHGQPQPSQVLICQDIMLPKDWRQNTLDAIMRAIFKKSIKLNLFKIEDSGYVNDIFLLSDTRVVLELFWYNKFLWFAKFVNTKCAFRQDRLFWRLRWTRSVPLGKVDNDRTGLDGSVPGERTLETLG